MFGSLSDYVKFLESEGELIRIKEFVDPVLEIAEVTDRVSKMPGGGKALLFENTGTRYPVLTNMMGSEKRMLYTLGAASFEEIEQRFEDIIHRVLKEEYLMDKLKMLPTKKRPPDGFPSTTEDQPPARRWSSTMQGLAAFPYWGNAGRKMEAGLSLPLVHTISSCRTAQCDLVQNAGI